MNFTNGNIILVYIERFTVEKKRIKIKQKNMTTCDLYQQNYRRN